MWFNTAKCGLSRIIVVLCLLLWALCGCSVVGSTSISRGRADYNEVISYYKKRLEIEVGETSEDGKFSLSCLRCVGACGLAPVVQVGDKTYGRVAPDDVEAILNEYVV